MLTSLPGCVQFLQSSFQNYNFVLFITVVTYDLADFIFSQDYSCVGCDAV